MIYVAKFESGGKWRGSGPRELRQQAEDCFGLHFYLRRVMNLLLWVTEKGPDILLGVLEIVDFRPLNQMDSASSSNGIILYGPNGGGLGTKELRQQAEDFLRHPD